MKQLFQYAVLYKEHEEVEGKKVYKDTIILVEPTTLLAKTEKEVAFKATRQIEEKYAEDSENIQIIVRPF